MTSDVELAREIRAAFADVVPATADPALAGRIRTRLAAERVVRLRSGSLVSRSALGLALVAAVIVVVVAIPLLGGGRTPGPSGQPGTVASPSPSVSASPTITPSSSSGDIPVHQGMFGDEMIVQAKLVTDSVGWVVTRERVYRTADAGRTWTDVLTRPSGDAVVLVDADTAYVPSATHVLVTHDGGASWRDAALQPGDLPSHTSGPILTVRSPQLAYATWQTTVQGQAGRLRVFETTDGGATWSDLGQSTLPDGEANLAPSDNRVLMPDLSEAAMKPFYDHLWLSTDGGHTWPRRTFPAYTIAYSKWVIGTALVEDSGLIVLPIRESEGSGDALYESLDNGQTWHTLRSFVDYRRFDPLSERQWRVSTSQSGATVAWWTADGGASWWQVQGNEAPGETCCTTSWPSPARGWSFHTCDRNPPQPGDRPRRDPYCDGNSLTSILFETSDGGATWTPIGG